ncbi:starch phosphorylase [Parelusimicrobium proximum]|uniref:alpha-glucan family phosphorylase n=1 Tax=Parelusimicrobium proximum TaxID=3228953 RepID=UPI003D171A36
MKIHSFNVQPNLPENMKCLQDIVNNMWFAWNWEAINLFTMMDKKLWSKAQRNPKWFLGSLPQKRFEELSNDAEFMARLEKLKQSYENYLNSKDAWYKVQHDVNDKFQVAYFSMEYGIGEGLPIYSGGLGMLSGDHIKSASDLNMPIIGIGLFYQRGYVKQQLNRDGWQNEVYPENDWANMPVERLNGPDGKSLRISVNLAGDTVYAAVWRVPVGRTSLYLLDTNVAENKPEYRTITEQLYGGDRENRIRQEVILGIGGVKVLKALGITPTVYHINEGHSAFLLIERIIELMKEKNISYKEAYEIVWATSVFTTHTPVIAGNEHFDPMLVKKYMESYSKEMGITWDAFLDLGKDTPAAATFCMTVLAIKISAYLNGVSVLHGKVSQEMWRNIWPDLPVSEVPITAVTNGIHSSSWCAHEFIDLYNKYCFNGNFQNANWAEQAPWDNVKNIPSEEIWQNHTFRKDKLIDIVRRRAKHLMERNSVDAPTVKKEVSKILKPEVLTIGFARRFATYKRANLLFKDLDRLDKIVNNPERPVQFVFAGKAHPADTQGKEYIKYIYNVQNEPRFRGKVVFVEDYNMNLARYMVQGVDVWLNNPIRPLEASGTSGMKAALNGVLALSVLDGWWDEVGPCDFGWSIGGREPYKTDEERDAVEAEAMYSLIENEIAPAYYQKGDSGLPEKWIDMMKESVRNIAPFFNTHRMVEEYYHKFYIQAHKYGQNLENPQALKELSDWRNKISSNWYRVSVSDVTPASPDEIKIGDTIAIRARVTLGALSPDDVQVQLYTGIVGLGGEMKGSSVTPMQYKGAEGDSHIYEVEYRPDSSGRHDYSLRVLPKHDGLANVYTPPFIRWE